MNAVITKSQLAQELGVTKGAVTGYVRRGIPVRSDGKLNRAEALAWVNGHVEPRHADRGAAVAGEVQRRTVGRGTDDEVPIAYQAILKCRSEHHAIACFGALKVAYAAPADAAVLAIAAGASLPVAYALWHAMIIAVMPYVAEVAELPEDEVTFDLSAFTECDWPVLAAKVGEPVDLVAWDQWLHERFGDDGETGSPPVGHTTTPAS